MQTPLTWISMYTPLSSLLEKHNTSELAHLYSIHTAEIDNIIETYIDKIVIGKVLTCEKHPDSKKLSIVRVDLGIHGEETILTGAANIVNATYVPVAMIGAKLSPDFEITERTMAGIVSRGMICSEEELGLISSRAEGIFILEEYWDKTELESKKGQSVFDLLLPFPGIKGETALYPLKNITFEIDNKFITNRPDLFSIIGNAREWHAIFSIPTTVENSSESVALPDSGDSIVTIQTEKCLAYSLMETTQEVASESPLGMRVMMHFAGLTPKLDYIDITQLIMTEYGQPMHAFDADTVQGNIIVRMAHDKESFEALDGKTYTLTNRDIVIADDLGVIALAGIIGGMRTSVSETTQRVLWESATFDATTIRLSSQYHALRTDASTRFEKSLDLLGAGRVFHRVLEYIQYAKKTPTIHRISHWKKDTPKTPTIELSKDMITRKAGIEIDSGSIVGILSRLGFHVTEKDDTFLVGVPSWRATKDISIPEDIVEEVLRVHGYSSLPSTPLSGLYTLREANTSRDLESKLLQHFSLHGWNEVYNYSFTNTTTLKKIGYTLFDECIAMTNAYTEDFTHMRPTLAHGLCKNISENLRHRDALSFFEIGKIYHKDIKRSTEEEELLKNETIKPYGERKVLSGMTTRHTIDELRHILESLLESLLGYIPSLHQHTQPTPLLHPNISGQYRIGDTPIAFFGQIHPRISEEFEIPENTLYMEIEYESLREHMQKKEIYFRPISIYQAVPRELNFILPEHAETGEIARIIQQVHPWITPVTIDSVYRDDEKIGAGKRSVNFAFSLQSMDQTISDDDAQVIQSKIIEKMAELGYSLRSI